MGILGLLAETGSWRGHTKPYHRKVTGWLQWSKPFASRKSILFMQQFIANLPIDSGQLVGFGKHTDTISTLQEHCNCIWPILLWRTWAGTGRLRDSRVSHSQGFKGTNSMTQPYVQWEAALTVKAIFAFSHQQTGTSTVLYVRLGSHLLKVGSGELREQIIHMEDPQASSTNSLPCPILACVTWEEVIGT